MSYSRMAIQEATGRKRKRRSMRDSLMKFGGAALGYGAGHALGSAIPGAPDIAKLGGGLTGAVLGADAVEKIAKKLRNA